MPVGSTQFPQMLRVPLDDDTIRRLDRERKLIGRNQSKGELVRELVEQTHRDWTIYDAQQERDVATGMTLEEALSVALSHSDGYVVTRQGRLPGREGTREVRVIVEDA